MKVRLLNVGFGNVVVAGRIVAIVSPGSAPIKRLKEDAREQGRLIDATYGRKTRAIVVTDSNHVILSAINPQTAVLRLMGRKIADPPTEDEPLVGAGFKPAPPGPSEEDASPQDKEIDADEPEVAS